MRSGPADSSRLCLLFGRSKPGVIRGLPDPGVAGTIYSATRASAGPAVLDPARGVDAEEPHGSIVFYRSRLRVRAARKTSHRFRFIGKVLEH